MFQRFTSKSIPKPVTAHYGAIPKHQVPRYIVTTALDRFLCNDYAWCMKTAEVEVNRTLTIKLNDREKHSFKVQCVKNGTEMSVVLREFMRDYVSRKGKR